MGSVVGSSRAAFVKFAPFDARNEVVADGISNIRKGDDTKV